MAPVTWCGPTGPGSSAGSPVWAPPCLQGYSSLSARSAMEVSLWNSAPLFLRLTVIVVPQKSGSIRHLGCSLPLVRTLYSKGSPFRVIPGQMSPAVGKALAHQCWSHLKAQVVVGRVVAGTPCSHLARPEVHQCLLCSCFWGVFLRPVSLAGPSSWIRGEFWVGLGWETSFYCWVQKGPGPPWGG